MTREITHEEVQLALAAEALETLTGEERDAALAHVDGCAECAAALAALRDTVAALAYATPTASLDPGRRARMRGRLLARAAADGHARTPGASPGGETGARTPHTEVTPLRPQVTAAPPRRSRGPWLMAAALTALMVGAAAYAFTLRREVRGLSAQIAVLERTVNVQRDSFQRELGVRERLLAGLTGPAVRVVQLAAGGARAPSGRMFWDQSTDAWTFFAHNLPAMKPGRTYQLWLITPGQRKLPAGTFAPQNGNARVSAQFALPRDSLFAVAVTDEPAGGVPQPTGPIVLVGQTRRSE